MKLTKNTFEILSNFSKINQNILIKSGSVLRTISEQRDVVGKATVDVTFPREIALYDLRGFLKNILLVNKNLNKITLDFGEEDKLCEKCKVEKVDEFCEDCIKGQDYVLISDDSGTIKTRYFYTNPVHITSTEKDITMPEPVVSFSLDLDTINKLKAVSDFNKVKTIVITPVSDEFIKISLDDYEKDVLKRDDKFSDFSIEVRNQNANHQTDNYRLVLHIDNLRMLDGDNYNIHISSNLLTHITNKEKDIEYFVALKKSSTYDNQEEDKEQAA